MDIIKYLKSKKDKLSANDLNKLKEMERAQAGPTVKEVLENNKAPKKKVKKNADFLKKAGAVALVAGTIFTMTACGRDKDPVLEDLNEAPDIIIEDVEDDENIYIKVDIPGLSNPGTTNPNNPGTSGPSTPDVSDEEIKAGYLEEINSMIADRYGYSEAKLKGVEVVTYDGAVKPTSDDTVLMAFDVDVVFENGQEKSGTLQLYVPFSFYSTAVKLSNPQSPYMRTTAGNMDSTVTKLVKDMLSAGFQNASLKSQTEEHVM